MEKLTKQDLKRPDLFVQETSRLAQWGLKHQKTFMGILGAFVIFGLGWAGWSFYSEQQEQKAQNLLYEAESARKKNLSADEVAQKFKGIVENHSGTKGAVVAALEYSKIQFDKADFKSSVPLLEKVKNTAKDPAVKGMVFYSLAVNLASAGDCAKAVDVWNQVEARDDLHFLLGAAYLEKAACLETLGQKDKAEQIYKKAEGMGKNPEVARLAKKYLRLLK